MSPFFCSIGLMASPQPGWSPLNAPGDRWVPLDAPIITHNGVQGWFVTADMQVPQAFIQQVQMLALERAGMVELTVHPSGQITGVVPSSSSSSSSGSARSRALRSVDSWGQHDPVDPDYIHLGQVYTNPTADDLAQFHTNALLREATRWGPTAAHGAAEDSREAAVAALPVHRITTAEDEADRAAARHVPQEPPGWTLRDRDADSREAALAALPYPALALDIMQNWSSSSSDGSLPRKRPRS